jgi:hypothetical protein
LHGITAQHFFSAYIDTALTDACMCIHVQREIYVLLEDLGFCHLKQLSLAGNPDKKG